MPWASDPWRLQGEAQYVLHQDAAARVNFRKAIAKDPNNWLVWADLATVSPHGAWRAPARRALELNPLAPAARGFPPGPRSEGVGMLRRDPLANPEPLIRRVYQYVSYRVGDGPDAEDITGEVFVRAMQYRQSYDSSRGDPAAWLIGIAQRCIAGAARPLVVDPERADRQAPGKLDEDVQRRLALKAALAALSDRDRELLALRYGADLAAKQIADVLELKVNAVEVGVHRALARLREVLESEGIGDAKELLASL